MSRQFQLATFVASITFATSLYAQSPATPDEEIDQIIVTAARTPVAVSQVGSATTVITREQIDRRQMRYVTDLLRTVPGFSIARSGVVGSQTQVRVRGAEANHVLVLIDGIRANDPGSGDEFRWEYLSTGAIERVEIVRGPQSSLWGSDAVAAVVHIITRPGHGKPFANGYAEGGSNSTANVGLNGGTNIGSWQFGGGIEYLDTEGQNISRSGSEKDGSDLTTASLSVGYDASASLAFDAGARLVDAYSQFDAVDFATGLPADSDVATESSQTYLQLGSRLSTLDGDLVHSLRVNYFDADNDNLQDGSQSSSTSSDRLRVSYQADIRLAENQLALAVEHEITNFEQRGAINFGDPNQDQEMDVTSVVADLQGNSFERLTWMLSARFDANSDFEDALTGRLSLAYALGERTTLRAHAGTAQKNPTFTERFGFFPGQFVGNPSLDPERSRSFEIGVGQSFLDSQLSLELSLFQSKLKDEINGFVFDPVTFLSTAENRPGDSDRSGVEFAASWQVTESLAVSGAYTYTDSSFEEEAGQESRELRRPRHTGSVSTSWRFAAERAELALTADYSGESLDQFFPPFPEPAQRVTLDNFWLVDLNASFRISDSASVFVRGTNLLDEDYEQVFGYQTMGRAAYAGLRLNFGQ